MSSSKKVQQVIDGVYDDDEIEPMVFFRMVNSLTSNELSEVVHGIWEKNEKQTTCGWDMP